MTTSIVLCNHHKFIIFNPNLIWGSSYPSSSSFSSSNFMFRTTKTSTTNRILLSSKFICKAEKHSSSSSSSWWNKFFFQDDGNWLGLKEDDMLEEVVVEEEEEEEGESEENKFEAWKQRAEAIIELREAQQDRLNEDSRKWEDWLVLDSDSDSDSDSWMKDYYNGNKVPPDYDYRDEGKGLVKSIRSLIYGGQQQDEEEDMLYEDRVFQYASTNSAKFLAVLIIIPWALDFLVHDYVLMPFLDRYVKTVPLAAQILDVRRYQKLQIVEELKTERKRFEFEVEIGKSPPLSDDDIWWELRHKALDLRDEWRLENRRAFANIWSDAVYGISLFILLYFNKSQVALLKFTGYKIINNISDTGKAFLIILVTDIFLGYHSESGWQTLVEIIVDHYGLEIDHSAITIFICLVPVIMDACVKLWLFKFLPRLSPKVSNIFQEMKRH